MSKSGFDDEINKLIQASLDARNLSYSPYSKFRVGAAILCENGEIVLGANVENASYGGTICAERTALVKAITSGHAPGSFRAIAVSSDLDATCSPCGICRQVIREFCSLDTPIYLAHSSWTSQRQAGSAIVVKSLEELLPLSFGPEDLQRPRS